MRFWFEAGVHGMRLDAVLYLCERDYLYRSYASDPKARLNPGIRCRAPLLDNDRHRIELMNLLPMILPGSPMRYYGDEIGMGDHIERGDRMSRARRCSRAAAFPAPTRRRREKSCSLRRTPRWARSARGR